MIGATVTLHVRTRAQDPDSMGDPVYTDSTVEVHNVLIGQPTTDEVTSSIDLYGKRTEYMLGIPKGDDHDWEDTEVEFFGRAWQTFGSVIQGIEANVPTMWHKKVRVARHE